MPCGRCNPSTELDPPRMPTGFVDADDTPALEDSQSRRSTAIFLSLQSWSCAMGNWTPAVNSEIEKQAARQAKTGT